MELFYPSAANNISQTRKVRDKVEQIECEYELNATNNNSYIYRRKRRLLATLVIDYR
jgi:hypothetical protein